MLARAIIGTNKALFKSALYFLIILRPGKLKYMFFIPHHMRFNFERSRPLVLGQRACTRNAFANDNERRPHDKLADDS